MPLDHLRFGLEFADEFGDRADLDAGHALGRLGDFDGLEARRRVDAEVGGMDGLDRLFARLHDVRQTRIPRLIEAEVGRDDCREL